VSAIVMIALVACASCTSPHISLERLRPAAITIRGSAAVAAEPIDRYETYQVFFTLEKAVPAISVSVSADYVADIFGTKKSRRTYFIVEKRVAIPRRGGAANAVFVELGRNFDADWNREKDILIASDATRPFHSLNPSDLYRVRFTAFAREPFEFTITVKADCGVAFVEKWP